MYWLAVGPSARTSGGRLGTATLLPSSCRRRRVVPHSHFGVCGTVQFESFELSKRLCSGAMHRREPSAALPLCTRAVAASEQDVLVTHLAIECAGNNLIGRPVVHDGLARLQAPRHGHVECVSHVLLHGSRPERRADGVTRLGIDSCISTLRCRDTVTAVSSKRLFV